MTGGTPRIPVKTMNLDDRIGQKLRHCETLPSLPAIAVRVISLANDPQTQMVQIADLVSLDPGLATKMLKVANSPLYGSRRKVDTVHQAVNLLGTHGAISIALSFSLSTYISGQPKEGFDATHFLRRSILSAIAARAIGAYVGLDHLDDLFLASLLQDVGILALSTMLTSEYAPILERAAGDHDALLIEERRALHVGHDEVGAWLLERWKLPEHLTRAVLASHAELTDDDPLFARCVALSGYIADMCIKAEGGIAARAAFERLGIEPEGVDEILHGIAGVLHDMEDLFELELLSHAETVAVLHHARELHLIHELQKTKELEERSQRDALTGTYNRGFFDETLRREFDIALRRGWPLSVALIDLDHFKSVNDTYGHPLGDTVLISVARAAMGQLRQTDAMARYGGEEFAVILPDTDVDQAKVLLQRVRERIALLEHRLDDGTAVAITASIGVASFAQQSSLYHNPEEILKAADRALYVAKRAGRNQVAVDDSGIRPAA